MISTPQLFGELLKYKLQQFERHFVHGVCWEFVEDKILNISGMVKHTQNEHTCSKYLTSPSLVMVRVFLGLILYFHIFYLWLHLRHYEGLLLWQTTVLRGSQSLKKFGLDNSWRFMDSQSLKITVGSQDALGSGWEAISKE